VIKEKMGEQGYYREDEGEDDAGDEDSGSDDPIRPEAMDGLCISRFARAFLSRARRPKWCKFVAPGIGFFDEETLKELYSAEPKDSRRRTVPTWEKVAEEESWISLLLPGMETVPDVSQHPDFRVNSFENEHYGFKQYTFDRRTGLYTHWDTDEDGDHVQLLAPSGRTDICEFGNRCPWGPHRFVRLAEILAHWATLVENGTWEVDGDGVKGPSDWFDANMELAKLKWGEDDMVL